VALAFRDELRRYVDREFDGNQSTAGRRLGIDQSHLSALLSGKRGVGLPVLLLLRDRTGRTVDEWLGFRTDDAATLDRVRQLLEAATKRG
jgi:plasmid maintenance system antidote protein VapI